MDIRHDTYTGGEHYFIRFRNGIHEVVQSGFHVIENDTVIEVEPTTVVFTGHFEKCLEWLKNKKAENVAYDHNL